MMRMIAVVVTVAMTIGICASIVHMGVMIAWCKGCKTCPESQISMENFLQKGLKANPVPTGSEQTQF